VSTEHSSNTYTTMSVVAEPSTSLAASVADESEEIAAEAVAVAPKVEEGTGSAPPPASTTATTTEEVKEEKVDPNALPEDACVTLYLQNLNEKVRIPGKSKCLLFMAFKADPFSDEADSVESV